MLPVFFLWSFGSVRRKLVWKPMKIKPSVLQPAPLASYSGFSMFEDRNNVDATCNNWINVEDTACLRKVSILHDGEDIEARLCTCSLASPSDL
ncbi:hypothetical protein PLEOSDRAFT_158900 [Pleurotus ostreatus PC15]|uniref:Uncharacterized protein n=1 Tax=Pleurotus ostreatus (strain PC15) TaxID=1137138 RepID=A0A067NGI4_PLEO1|nr:hypothetical protein PLEOSDRAFT_158900 [Pleurotus ostreatus PC15]